MGKGDRRSRKGKVWRHSYGNTRKKKGEKRPAFTPKVKKEKKAPVPKLVEMAEPVAVETAAAPVAATAAPKAKKAAPAKKKAEPKEAKAAAPKKKAAAKKK